MTRHGIGKKLLSSFRLGYLTGDDKGDEASDEYSSWMLDFHLQDRGIDRKVNWTCNVQDGPLGHPLSVVKNLHGLAEKRSQSVDSNTYEPIHTFEFQCLLLRC